MVNFPQHLGGSAARSSYGAKDKAEAFQKLKRDVNDGLYQLGRDVLGPLGEQIRAKNQNSPALVDDNDHDRLLGNDEALEGSETVSTSPTENAVVIPGAPVPTIDVTQ